jgi:hypothetical protein
LWGLWLIRVVFVESLTPGYTWMNTTRDGARIRGSPETAGVAEDLPKVKLWYDRPMPADWKLGEAAWEWHCFRTKGLREEDRRRLEQGLAPEAKKAGATAGWRDVARGTVKP